MLLGALVCKALFGRPQHELRNRTGHLAKRAWYRGFSGSETGMFSHSGAPISN